MKAEKIHSPKYCEANGQVLRSKNCQSVWPLKEKGISQDFLSAYTASQYTERLVGDRVLSTLHEHEEGESWHSQHWILPVFTALGILCGIHDQVRADSINCKDYQLSEFRALCQYASKNATYVHDDVAVDGLNHLVDGWNTDEFHIIPPAVYVLDKPVELGGIILMPHPSSASPGSPSTTIGLQVSSGFKYSSDAFNLLSLKADAGAGGIEIHGEQLPDNLPALPSGSSLVYMPDGLNNRFTGSILTGHSKVDTLLRYDNTTYYGEDEDTVSIHRNYFRLNGSSAGAQVSAGNDNATPHLFNNVFLMDSAQKNTAAVKHVSNYEDEPGGIELRNNDIVYLDGSSNGQRYGLEIIDAPGSVLLNNAFYSSARVRKDSDIGIFAHRQSGHSNRWLILSGNGFSPGIVPGRSSNTESGSSINLLEVGSVIYPLAGSYQRMTPDVFFAETGMLGMSASSVAWLQSTNSTVCSADYQPHFFSSDPSLNEYAESALNLFQQEGGRCEKCHKIYGDGSYLPSQMAVLAAVVFTTVFTGPLCGWGCYSACRGQCRLPCR